MINMDEKAVENLLTQQNCRHETLTFTVGGGEIVCTACKMRYGALGPLGFQLYNYYNVNILSTDTRVNPLKTHPPVH